MINFWAVLLAAVANMIVGSLWYGPIFGKTWMGLTGMSTEQLDSAKAKGMGKTYALAFVGALVMGYVFARIIAMAGVGTTAGGAELGFWAWLGFVASVMLGEVLWEGKSSKLWFLESGYYLVVLLVMGAILGGWR
ncbi:MAG: DUF1761 domain-containing protein [Candidatus Liptonbacteria bacterium]|nr:DUF1761 domain-containing protein [Candidatus Liptonbacteria bacterium]